MSEESEMVLLNAKRDACKSVVEFLNPVSSWHVLTRSGQASTFTVTTPMSAQTYPGRGLSLSQLIFALNEELKHVAFSPLRTLEAVSQLDRDASIALATIREWKNSFAHVNRIPTDILSLIPTHLPQNDRFLAASVCRHWRGVLLRNGTLWSQLFLRKGGECISTLLERTKGSALDVIVDHHVPVDILALIAPHAQQIVSIEFKENLWQDVIALSGLTSGQLPLLHTLKITPLEAFSRYGEHDVLISPPSRLFKGATNLQRFVICSSRVSSLSYFVFPNLTTFNLLPTQTDGCSASCLLDFLKASPMLQTVEMNISAKIMLGSVPQEMVVVLPNVETFSLHVAEDTLTQVYDFASHISCPLAKSTSLTHDIYIDYMETNLKIFPTPVVWNTIVHQYMASPVVEVTLEIKRDGYVIIACFLTFLSSDEIAVRLGFSLIESGLAQDELDMSIHEMGWDIFSQALTAIRDHPLTTHIKHLSIDQSGYLSNAPNISGVANKAQELFGSLGPLDKLTIRDCNLHTILANFLNNPGLDRLERPIPFPRIKEFKILYPSIRVNEVECMEAIVELAKSQHAFGIPFERVTVRMLYLHAKMAEELGRWVAAADCGLWCAGEDGEL